MKEEKKLPLVSVVILNYNGKKNLGNIIDHCLKSVLESNYPHFEVVFVDNASTDGSPSWVRQEFGHDPRLKVIVNSRNYGFSQGNNIGVKYATGEYVVFLNNDTEVDPMWLRELIKVMEADPSIGVSQSKILLMSERNRFDVAGNYISGYGFAINRGARMIDHGQFDFVDEIFSAKGAALTIRRKVLDEVDLFDPRFFAYFEEADLCWRVWLKGYRVVFVPWSIVYHAWGGTTSKVAPLQQRKILLYHGFKNRINTLIKNLGIRNLFEIVPKHIILCCGIILYFTLKRRPIDGFLIAKAILWNLTNLKNTWRKRNVVQYQIRTVPDEYIMSRVGRKGNISYFINLLLNVY